MRAYARVNVTLENGTEETKKIYREFKKKMKKYVFDEEMELYRIPVDVKEYAYAKNLQTNMKRQKMGWRFLI